MTKSINFTKNTLESLPLPAKGKRTYHNDTQVKGLSFAIQASGATSFYIIKKIEGRSAKIFLGKYPDLSIENARKKAKIVLGQIALGENPQADKQLRRDELTFGALFEQYMDRYSKQHKKTWLADQQDITRFCSQWFRRKLSAIDKNDVQRLHEKIFAENGPYMANTILKRIRAIYNKGIEWGWGGSNPTKGIKKYKEKSRDRFIQPNELRYILRALNNHENETIRDYFWLLLLTGVRKTNTVMMRWEQLHWERLEWRIPNTKNGEPVTIPLSDPAFELLQKRKLVANSPWVFPHADQPSKHVTGLKEAWKQIKGQAMLYMQEHDEYGAGLLMDIRIHDIRRTFGSYQAISGASLQVIGKSLGHKSTQATQIYARLDLDAVRSSVVKATDMMLSFQSA